MRESIVEAFHRAFNLYVQHFVLTNLAAALCDELLAPVDSISEPYCILFSFGAIAVDDQSHLSLAPFSDLFCLTFFGGMGNTFLILRPDCN